MEFLMQAFLRKLKGYSFLDFSYHQELDGSYLFIFRSLPPEVDVKIVRKTIKVHIMDDEKGNPIMEDRSICMLLENGLARSIKIVFDKNTYAKKMNFLDVIFRDYSEAHHYGK